jgi:hypothetical protein
MNIARIASVVGLFFAAFILNAGEKPAANQRKFKIFGAKPTLTTEVITLRQAFDSSNLNKLVKVKAKVEEVCQSMGCWLIVREGDLSVRIKTKDHKFYVPKTIAGRTVVVEGVVSGTVIEEHLAKHYAEDAGKSQQEIDAIVGEQREYSMIASSITLLP